MEAGKRWVYKVCQIRDKKVCGVYSLPFFALSPWGRGIKGEGGFTSFVVSLWSEYEAILGGLQPRLVQFPLQILLRQALGGIRDKTHRRRKGKGGKKYVVSTHSLSLPSPLEGEGSRMRGDFALRFRFLRCAYYQRGLRDKNEDCRSHTKRSFARQTKSVKLSITTQVIGEIQNDRC
jgi:hypothetical protein